MRDRFGALHIWLLGFVVFHSWKHKIPRPRHDTECMQQGVKGVRVAGHLRGLSGQTPTPDFPPPSQVSFDSVTTTFLVT